MARLKAINLTDRRANRSRSAQLYLLKTLRTLPDLAATAPGQLLARLEPFRHRHGKTERQYARACSAMN
jgi:hypothetical protein